MPYPVPYEEPWGRLAGDLRAVAASTGLKVRELWRRNGEGDLSVPGFWPAAWTSLFWPVLLSLVLASLVVLGLGLARGLGGLPSASSSPSLSASELSPPVPRAEQRSSLPSVPEPKAGWEREGEVERLKPYRLQGAYTALLAPESQRDRVPEGVGFVSPEALTRLARLKGRFPLTPWDLEDLLKEGRVDLEAVEALEDRLAAELSERGAFAALLLLLARKPLGEVFLLADLEAEALEEGLVPEVVRQGVEVLAQPPFLLLKRLSPGEFLLRQSVEEALEDLRAFAEGLAGRLSRARSL